METIDTSVYNDTDNDELEYTLAKRNHDDRIKDLIRQKNDWRRLAFIGISVCLLLVGGLIYVGTLPKTSSQVLLVDRASGNTWMGGKSTETGMDKEMWDKVKYGAFTKFVWLWRTVTTDERLERRNWDNSYEWVQNRSNAQLDLYKWFTAHDPIVRARTETVAIFIDGGNAVTGNTYEVEWTETIYKGGQETTGKYRALLTYRVSGKPLQPDNTFGILITEYSITPVAAEETDK